MTDCVLVRDDEMFSFFAALTQKRKAKKAFLANIYLNQYAIVVISAYSG